MTRQKTYLPGGKIIHRITGRGLPLLGEHKAVKHIEEVAHAVKIGGISDAALKRLEALKPRELPKRPNIRF